MKRVIARRMAVSFTANSETGITVGLELSANSETGIGSMGGSLRLVIPLYTPREAAHPEVYLCYTPREATHPEVHPMGHLPSEATHPEVHPMYHTPREATHPEVHPGYTPMGGYTP